MNIVNFSYWVKKNHCNIRDRDAFDSKRNQKKKSSEENKETKAKIKGETIRRYMDSIRHILFARMVRK